MRSLLWNGAGSACEAARLRASLALDGDLDEMHGLLLQRHLDRCPECADAVRGIDLVTTLVRDTRLEPRPRTPVAGRRPARRLPWANIGVAVATLAVGSLTLPNAPSPGSLDPAPRLAAPPPRLPLGQRSAADDFVTERPETTPRSAQA